MAFDWFGSGVGRFGSMFLSLVLHSVALYAVVGLVPRRMPRHGLGVQVCGPGLVHSLDHDRVEPRPRALEGGGDALLSDAGSVEEHVHDLQP